MTRASREIQRLAVKAASHLRVLGLVMRVAHLADERGILRSGIC